MNDERLWDGNVWDIVRTMIHSKDIRFPPKRKVNRRPVLSVSRYTDLLLRHPRDGAQVHTVDINGNIQDKLRTIVCTSKGYLISTKRECQRTSLSVRYRDIPRHFKHILGMHFL